ncbi:MAG TPA: hypothetical protein VN030_08790 [Cellvibrio sp.]|nr:hypothetical protein [Cellvibrio sp.]
MIAFIRHSTRRCRAWLIALAAILLLTSVLESGHNHGTLTPEGTHCALCQYAFHLDKLPPSDMGFILPLLLTIVIHNRRPGFNPSPHQRFVVIRAPPSVPAL